MRGITRRRDRDHGPRLRHVGRGGEGGGAAQAVTDQDCGRTPDVPQGARRCQKVGDIGRERGVGEFAVASSEPGEVEAQHADAERGQRLRDAARRMHVLAAGKAMREQRIGPRLTGRHVKERGEPLSLRVDEVEPFGGHGESSLGGLRTKKYVPALSGEEAAKRSFKQASGTQRSLNQLLPYGDKGQTTTFKPEGRRPAPAGS